MTKSEQRQYGLAARRALSQAERAQKSALLCARIEASSVFQNAKTILSYRAMPDEADLGGLAAAGKIFAYPRCVSPGVMEALVPHSGAFLSGAFGIETPDPASACLLLPEDIDLVLVPCSAFDGSGGRVGMGGGYYDRFLPACINAARMLAAFEAQRLPAVESGPLDARMDWAVTENMLYDCR